MGQGGGPEQALVQTGKAEEWEGTLELAWWST